MTTPEEIARDRADWLIDAVAMASQNRILLRGDENGDDVLIEAVEINARKAIEVAIQRALAAQAAEIAALRQQVEKYRARLEVDHCFQFGGESEPVRVEMAEDVWPDGIECRNETIKLQDERIEALRRERDEAILARSTSLYCLGFFASVIKSGEPWTETCQAEYDKAKEDVGPAVRAALSAAQAERDAAREAAQFHEFNWQQERDLKVHAIEHYNAAQAEMRERAALVADAMHSNVTAAKIRALPLTPASERDSSGNAASPPNPAAQEN